MAPKRPLALVIGAILMLALGLARGAGGAVLLVRGRATLPDLRADAAVLPVLACFLILIGAAEVAAAIGVFRLKRAFWRLGVAATAAFVVDGAVHHGAGVARLRASRCSSAARPRWSRRGA